MAAFYCHTFRLSSPSSTLSKKDVDTLSKASRGHSVNQSMVQQFTRDGNIRQRVLKALPTGLIHSTMWRLFLTLLIQKSQIASLLPSAMPTSLAAGRQPMISCSYSSGSNRFGTSPEFRMLLMSSKNSSTTIYNRNIIHYIQQSTIKQFSIYINYKYEVCNCQNCLLYTFLTYEKLSAKFHQMFT